MKKKETWKLYYDKTKDSPPRKLLVKAANFLSSKERALDLGAGAFNDVLYLLSTGFNHVTAVDSSPVAREIAASIPPEKVTYAINSFENFVFTENTYDLINAQYALPFNRPETFSRLMDNIIFSMKPGGIFTGQFFGKKDEWNVAGSGKTFHTLGEVKGFFERLKIIELIEEEKDRKTVDGNMKHWHVFHVIAQKP